MFDFGLQAVSVSHKFGGEGASEVNDIRRRLRVAFACYLRHFEVLLRM